MSVRQGDNYMWRDERATGTQAAAEKTEKRAKAKTSAPEKGTKKSVKKQ